MIQLTQDEISAVVEASLGMSRGEALRFYVAQLGCSLRGGERLFVVVLAEHPDSRLARSIRESQES